MRTSTQRFRGKKVGLAAVFLVFFCARLVWSQDTAFSYQGRLTDAGSPANGTYDLQFKLFDTAVVGTGVQQGATIVSNPVAVSNGIFMVTLDFGSSVFTGESRYLEIGVRPSGSAAGYTILNPRQKIASSPYAIQTLNATQLGGVDASRYVKSDENGNVGIGTATPATKLDIAGDVTAFKFIGNGSLLTNLPGGTTTEVNCTSPCIDSNEIVDGTIGNVDISDTAAIAPSKIAGTSATLAGNTFTGNQVVNVSSGHAITGATSSVSGQAITGVATDTGGANYGGYFSSASSSGRGVYGAAPFTGVEGNASAASGLTFGGYFSNASSGGRGVVGNSTAANGATYGGYFSSASGGGTGVKGDAIATSGNTYGGQFSAASTSGTGVQGYATAATGVTYGGDFRTNSNSGRGVVGVANAANGVTYGGYFSNASNSGRAVYGTAPFTGVEGNASATSGVSYGGYFSNSSTSGFGVVGNASATSGASYGGYFVNASTSGTGVYGYVTATSGVTHGGDFRSDSTTGRGVFSLATAASGTNYGVYAQSNSASGRAIYGTAPFTGVEGNATAPSGITYGGYFHNASTSGLGVVGNSSATSGTTYGGYFTNASTSGTGIYGVTLATTGNTYGGHFSSISDAGTGVVGTANSPIGYTFGGHFTTSSESGVGIQGESLAPTGNAIGGRFFTYSSSGGKGIHAEALAPTGFTYGVFGKINSTTGYAGYFSGDVYVSGTLTAGSKTFKIDHPMDPANRYLYHSVVESPDMKNIYDGTVQLDEQGEATVTLPAWFETLNGDFRYQLTAIGVPAPNLYIAEGIHQNRFRIAGGKSGTKVSWQVTGVRQDPFARDHRVQVEADKPDDERGYYLYPEGYGQRRERGMEYAHQSSDPTAFDEQ